MDASVLYASFWYVPKVPHTPEKVYNAPVATRAVARRRPSSDGPGRVTRSEPGMEER